MHDESIEVETEQGDTLTVQVFSKHADRIVVVIGEGQHCVKCNLSPTPNGRAYSGSVMGRELVYARSPEQVQKEIELMNPNLRPRGR